jgi:2-polyprenyl-3-methyl-5-hydroxy-6-metoxy-1,4-benzoquinol methylase
MEREAWNARYADSTLLWGVEPNRFVEREVAGLTPGRAVDLACGEGRNAIWLASRGWRVTGVDFADVAIEKGRKLAAAEGVDVDWRVEDVRTWVPEAGAFDLVLLAYLQLPIDERSTVFRHAAAAVAPGGAFLLVAHDARNIADGYGGPQYPEVLCGADEVVTWLDGFDVVHAGEVLRPVTLDDGSTVHAIDTLVRATRR